MDNVYNIFEFIINVVCVYLTIVALIYVVNIIVFCYFLSFANKLMHMEESQYIHTTQVYDNNVALLKIKHAKRDENVKLMDYVKKYKKDVKPFLKDVDVKF